jgi:hypothetical protein
VKNLEIGKGLCPFDVSLKGESMVKYMKKVAENLSSSKKRQFFTKTQENRFKFYFKFILKLLSPQLGLLYINYKISKTLE